MIFSAAIALVVTAPLIVQAQNPANSLLVFTEHSSTVLEATVGGVAYGTVSLIAADEWFWSLPATFPPSAARTDSHAGLYWLEPESTGNPKLGNVVSLGPNGDGAVIRSDFDTTGFREVVSDGAIVLGKLSYAFQDGTSQTFDVQFIDHGDRNGHVPDASSTAALLLLSGIAMLGAARIRNLHRRRTAIDEEFCQV